MLDDYSRDLRLAKRASTVILRSSKLLTRMSVKGHKRTWPHVRSMSALPPKADIAILQLSGERLAMMLTTLNVITTLPA